MKPWTKWRDWSTLVLGALLFVAPLGLAAANTPMQLDEHSLTLYTWIVWIIGILVVALALWKCVACAGWHCHEPVATALLRYGVLGPHVNPPLLAGPGQAVAVALWQ